VIVRAFIASVVLGACVTAPRPVERNNEVLFQLAPAALGRELHLAQRVTFVRGSTTMSFDAQLEADASALKLAAFALGQTVARMTWDGVRLEETHSQRVPDVVTPARIMSDVQLAFWPEESIRAALPAGYSLQTAPGVRRVLLGGEALIEVRYEGAGPIFPRIELNHLAHGFRMIIESTEAD
jgi:hypothetical protein